MSLPCASDERRITADAIRDRVRLRAPRVLAYYQRWLRPWLTGERRHIDLNEWFSQGVRFVNESGTAAIHIDDQGPWVEDPAGFLWLFEGGLRGSSTWAEHGQAFEGGEAVLLAELVAAGGTMVDIGANVGLHCIKLARRMPDLRIVAVEPVRSTVECLRRNMHKNGVSDKIEVHRVALSDHDGYVRMTTDLQIINFVVPDHARAAPRASEAVPCSRLDDLLGDRTGCIGLIKCDVEGSELSVLRGAARTLEESRPPIFIEIVERYCRRYGHHASAVFEYLHAHGYLHELVVDGQRRPSTGSVPADLAATTNFLFSSEPS